MIAAPFLALLEGHIDSRVTVDGERHSFAVTLQNRQAVRRFRGGRVVLQAGDRACRITNPTRSRYVLTIGRPQ